MQTVENRGATAGSKEALSEARERQIQAKEEKKLLFLDALGKAWPDVTLAAKACGWQRSSAWAERQTDEKFRQEWDRIKDEKLDMAENRILTFGLTDRGGVGYLFPFLRAHRRDTWGDKLEHSGQVGTFNITRPEGLSPRPQAVGRAEVVPEPANGQDKG